MTVKRTASGQHEAVKAFRAKLESIQDGALEELLSLNRELDAMKDPRRDGDSLPPVDVVFDDVTPTPEDEP